MIETRYATPPGGLPPQSDLLTGRAVFTEAYAVIPAGALRGITTSRLPHWRGAQIWMIARPMTGFAETFSHYVVELAPGGGSGQPEPNPAAEAVLFVSAGAVVLTLEGAGGASYRLGPGGYAFLPAGQGWTLENASQTPASFHWIRKRYEPAPGVAPPEAFVTNERDLPRKPMPGAEGRWATTRFVDPADMAHDMHVNIVTLQPGAVIPFLETHVMEHGLYVLEGKGAYRLNRDWVEVEAGDYMWLRAFCPQACYAGGPGPFRYLLYKDVNRHARLDL